MKKTLYFAEFQSPIGKLAIYATDKGVCSLEFDDYVHKKNYLKTMTKEAVVLQKTNSHLEQALQELKSYFEGKLKMFQVALDLQGTAFRISVWKVLLSIPYGKTMSYKEQAIALGNLKAIRAVATSNGANKIAIIVPCHRVIGSDGSLTGYASGLDRKKWLLDFERKNSGQATQLQLDL